jgi:hypothetical protein
MPVAAPPYAAPPVAVIHVAALPLIALPSPAQLPNTAPPNAAPPALSPPDETFTFMLTFITADPVAEKKVRSAGSGLGVPNASVVCLPLAISDAILFAAMADALGRPPRRRSPMVLRPTCIRGVLLRARGTSVQLLRGGVYAGVREPVDQTLLHPFQRPANVLCRGVISALPKSLLHALDFGTIRYPQGV